MTPAARKKTGKFVPEPAARDKVTVLMVAEGHRANKRFVKSATGVEKHNFSAGRLFETSEITVDDIEQMSALLTFLEAQPRLLIIRGQPAFAAVTRKMHPRTSSVLNPTFMAAPEGRRWALIDFDKTPLPPYLKLKHQAKSIDRVCDYLVSLLPLEFQDATFHWQLSSSAGMSEESVVSMHLWFWLAAPVTDDAMKSWARSVNEGAGRQLIDPSLFQCVQAHYTAAPEFDGLDDPFPTRSGLRKKACDEVRLNLPQPAKPGPRTRVGSRKAAFTTANARSGAGFDFCLSLIGDHPGGEGFHGPTVSAAASYVSEHGAEGTDVEHLYGLLRDAVLSAYADPMHHDAATVEQRASREHIMPMIESALAKFGDVPRARRKARLIEGAPPHFNGNVVSVEEAQTLLQKFATRGR